MLRIFLSGRRIPFGTSKRSPQITWISQGKNTMTARARRKNKSLEIIDISVLVILAA